MGRDFLIGNSGSGALHITHGFRYSLDFNALEECTKKLSTPTESARPFGKIRASFDSPQSQITALPSSSAGCGIFQRAISDGEWDDSCESGFDGGEEEHRSNAE